METATPAQIAAIRRRYLWMATSVFWLDLDHRADLQRRVRLARSNVWRSAISSVAMVAIIFFVARWLFEPVRLFLEGKASFESAQRRLTQLPLLTARILLPLALLAVAFRYAIPFWAPEAAGRLRATLADAIATALVLAVFYFTYTYFVVSDYLARLCDFIFRHYGRNLEPVLRQLPAEADRGAAGDLDRAARRHPGRPLLLRRASGCRTRSWSTAPRP